MKLDTLGMLSIIGLTSLTGACSSDSNRAGAPDGSAGGQSGATGGTAGSTGTGGSAGKVGAGGAVASGGATNATGGSGAGGSGGSKSTGGSAGVAGTAGSGGAGDGGVGGNPPGTGGRTGSPGDGGLHIDHVFVIAMENHDQSQIIGASADAPYINGTLLKEYASTSNFVDTLFSPTDLPSEPHYVLCEAGTNAFSDVTFTGDGDPTAGNSTASTEHLVTQMKNATVPVSWMSYQEGLDGTTGTCPIHSSGFYAPKHDPMIFFQDVSGSPPSASNAYCVAHHAATTQLAADLAGNHVAAYNFITPNLCNDMHGAAGCPNSNTVRSGDDWLKANLPDMITYANAYRGVIFIVWDEGASTNKVPFIAIGPSVKKNYVSAVRYTHASLVKSIETIFGLPFLATVKSETVFTDLFQDGRFP